LPVRRRLRLLLGHRVGLSRFGLSFRLLFPAIARTDRYASKRDRRGCRHQEKLPHVVLSFGLASYPEACVVSIRQFQAFLLRRLGKSAAMSLIGRRDDVRSAQDDSAAFTSTN
jgi:hypothetical protein